MYRFKINGLTFNSSIRANLFMTSSHKPLIFINAYLSKGVACKFTMISFPFLLTYLGIFAAGVTVKELPIARQRSALLAYSNDLSS